jgi:hypothetical protein
MPSSWLCLGFASIQRRVMVRLAGGMYADSGSPAAIQKAPPAAPRGGCA